MGNEYYGAPTTPTSDYLAHYGIKGMKWGVRKAMEKGGVAGARALSRQYAKAQKKLAKLERQAASGKKYAKRAAALGVGAAAAGGLAAAGTHGVGNAMHVVGKGTTKAMQGFGNIAGAVGRGITSAAYKAPVSSAAKSKIKAAGQGLEALGRNARNGAKNAGTSVTYAGEAVKRWGNSTSIGKGIQNAAGRYAGSLGAGKGAMFNTVASQNARNATKGIAKLSNNTIARIGAGAVGAGLGIGAGYNAYRAATTKKAAAKAAQFRKEMNKAFAGTQYANGGAPKRKRRRG